MSDEYTILTAQTDARNEAAEREKDAYTERTESLRLLRYGVAHGRLQVVEIKALNLLVILDELIALREKEAERL